ncbi:MAG: hypothetical protein GX044_05725 [Firmicutes bacterium]|jgi:glutamine amidotransferase-like uncharacterized protein|nr:hypothetical protein [Bacillota bacterium]
MKKLLAFFLVIALLLACVILANSYWHIFPASAPGSENGEEENPDSKVEEYPDSEAEPELNGEPEEPAAPEEFSPRIGIYSGSGSWEENVVAIINFFEHYGINYGTFDEQDASFGDLGASFDAIWFPGGFSESYRHYISNHDNLRAFVDEGGLFIGTCAGAYYASDIMLWLDEGEKLLDYPLKLFAGRAVGPHMRWGEHAVLTLNPDLPVNEAFDQTIMAHYFDGPYFIPSDEQEVAVLAEYESHEAPAILSFDYGNGKVLLMGPHPELGYEPATGLIDTRGGAGAQWPWLYAVLQWFFTD